MIYRINALVRIQDIKSLSGSCQQFLSILHSIEKMSSVTTQVKLIRSEFTASQIFVAAILLCPFPLPSFELLTTVKRSSGGSTTGVPDYTAPSRHYLTPFPYPHIQVGDMGNPSFTGKARCGREQRLLTVTTSHP